MPLEPLDNGTFHEREEISIWELEAILRENELLQAPIVVYCDMQECTAPLTEKKEVWPSSDRMHTLMIMR